MVHKLLAERLTALQVRGWLEQTGADADLAIGVQDEHPCRSAWLCWSSSFKVVFLRVATGLVGLSAAAWCQAYNDAAVAFPTASSAARLPRCSMTIRRCRPDARGRVPCCYPQTDVALVHPGVVPQPAIPMSSWERRFRMVPDNETRVPWTSAGLLGWLRSCSSRAALIMPIGHHRSGWCRYRVGLAVAVQAVRASSIHKRVMVTDVDTHHHSTVDQSEAIRQ